MTSPLRIWLLAAWALLVVGILVLNLVSPLPGLEDAWQWVGGQFAFPVAAALILARRPGNRVGLVLAVVANATLVSFSLYWFALTYPDSVLSPAAEAVSGAVVPIMFGGIIAVLHIFPTGSTLGRRHSWVFALFVAIITLLVVLVALLPGPLVESGRPNPFGVLPGWMRSLAENGFAILPLFAVAGVGSLVIRWRRADAVERAQLRWLLTAAAFFALVLLVIMVTGDAGDDPGSVGFVLASTVVLLGFWSVPGAIVVAVTRYRLYEIDRLISRTVSYAVVAGTIAAVFAAVAIGLPQLFGLTGDSPLMVAAATLVAAALFNPLRRWVQALVDRRFNRARYDAQQTVDAFASRLRTALELEELAGEVVGVVTRTMQPSSAWLWIKDAP